MKGFTSRLLPAMLLLLAAGCDSGDESVVDDPADDGLVWSDEFNYEGAPDPSKWDYDTGAGGWGNNEAQFYTNNLDNARVDGEHLIIEAHKEDLGGSSYTSARLVSRGKAAFLYGRVEARARIPAGVGTWPAIWMLPEDWEYGGWPDSGEIDIMEHVGKDEGRVHASLHMGELNHLRGNPVSGSISVPDATTAFHVYAVEWEPDEIRFYIDGTQVPLQTSAVPGVGRYQNPERGSGYWPFDKRFHLLMNIAIGGNWGGPDIDDTMFPVRMEVDYVRVYAWSE
ncbi:MAG: glycoside hydrolase family 16 protein [Rhodothermales bacterium]|nr:glycoside hydrolase family 16 protein [Rhodothermales bacterium]MBO6780008.1 glycoside hydrolase family 16 protein [Rhodothermales bacterium]